MDLSDGLAETQQGTHLAGFYEPIKDHLLLLLVWPHVFLQQFAFWPLSFNFSLSKAVKQHSSWSLTVLEDEMLTAVVSVSVQRLHSASAAQLCFFICELREDCVKWLKMVCYVMIFFSVSWSYGRRGWGAGGGLADNAPKYEQLNINRNAICCSPTNTHRDGGNKGNG